MDIFLKDFSIGLFIMQAVILLILILLMKKFAWKPILESLDKREEGIKDALEAAEKAKVEMEKIQSANDNLLKEARAERDQMIKDAKETASKMVNDAKEDAKKESEKIIVAAKATINEEKAAAIAELKTQVASFSIEIAEKVVRGELSSDDKQKALAEKLAEDINMN